MFAMLLADMTDVVFTWLCVASVAAVYFEGSAVLFVSGSVAFHSDCCCALCGQTSGGTQECNNCIEGTHDHDMEVVISGVANDSCTDCADLDATYILVRNALPTPPATCTWELAITQVCSSYDTARLFIGAGPSNDVQFQLRKDSDASQILIWNKTLAGVDYPDDDIDCSNFVDCELPAVTRVGSDCEAETAGATCLLTALP